MASNFVATVLAAVLALGLGTWRGWFWVEDWRAARAVLCDLEPIPGKADSRRVTAENTSRSTVTGMCVQSCGSDGVERYDALEGPPRDFAGPRNRARPGEQASADIVQSSGRIVRAGVIFTVTGSGRTYRKELTPGRELRRWYDTRYGQWGRWEFLRRRLKSTSFRARHSRPVLGTVRLARRLLRRRVVTG